VIKKIGIRKRKGYDDWPCSYNSSLKQFFTNTRLEGRDLVWWVLLVMVVLINSLCINEYNGIYKDFHRVLSIYLSK
jgi:hypothetical protein